MSTGHNPLPASLSLSHVKIVSNQGDLDLQTGRSKPPLFTSEPPQSIQLVIDGKNHSSIQNPFDFRASINNNLFRARMARVSKVVIPKPPNVTQHNNEINWTQWDGAVDTVLACKIPPGFYNTTTLANAIATCMTLAAGGLNVYVCTYNPLTRNFSVSYTNNFIPQLFFFHNDSEFIVRGQFLAGFQANDPSLSALVVGKSIWYSCVAGMVYTRYAIISSESFNQYSYSDSRTTTLQLKNNIICIVDMTGIYTTADFDDGVPYAGVYTGISTPEAPHLMITNPQRNMNDTVDILVQDEYGSSFNDLFTPQAVDVPNCIGVSLWMEISF